MNFDKKHIDNLGMNNRDKKNYDQDQDYKDLQNDVQLEENEEDGKALKTTLHIVLNSELTTFLSALITECIWKCTLENLITVC